MLVSWSYDWIKVVDEFYENGIYGPLTQKRWVKCIAVNQCWLANKKPNAISYSIEQV
ncbi:MAG: hypothetical protein K2L52_00295 [Clostridia bacterium]|nr:hypothetical protein [Clostridia bacterium]